MPHKVIGAGYGRTGTASLKLALERLGFGPCHHMAEVLPKPERVALWARIGAGSNEWDQALAGYNATVDWPACTHWRALADLYPHAKVILSTRDPDRWFDSVHATILNPDVTRFLLRTPMGEMLDRNIYSLFGAGMADRAFMVDAFKRHNDEVKRAIPADRLLVFDAREGWGPLSAFLGVDPPAEPYPHVNTKEETARLFEHMMAAAGNSRPSDIQGFADRLFTPRPAEEHNG
jgi:hypothetical protein